MILAELIQEVKNGSVAAEYSLFNKLHKQAWPIARSYAKNSEDAEDILQNSFMAFFKSLAGFHYQNDGAVYAWLTTIIKNQSHKYLRKQKGLSFFSESEAEEMPAVEDLFNKMEGDEIYKTISRLPFGYRSVFILHIIDGMGHRETGKILNISEGTCKSQLNKARVLLQKILTAKGIGYEQRKDNK